MADIRLAPHLLASVLVMALAPASLAGQAAEPAQLGLAASSALGVHGGAGIFRYAALGPEVGGTIDIGWIGTRRVRLALGVDFLSTTIDRVDSLGTRARGRGYVFSAFTDVNVTTSPERRIAPYAGVGFGVNAVGSAIGNAQIDAIYNTNVLDLHAQVGFLAPITRGGRGALKVEVRATGARVVRRVAAHVGYTWLFNDFAPDRRRSGARR